MPGTIISDLSTNASLLPTYLPAKWSTVFTIKLSLHLITHLRKVINNFFLQKLQMIWIMTWPVCLQHFWFQLHLSASTVLPRNSHCTLCFKTNNLKYSMTAYHARVYSECTLDKIQLYNTVQTATSPRIMISLSLYHPQLVTLCWPFLEYAVVIRQGKDQTNLTVTYFHLLHVPGK